MLQGVEVGSVGFDPEVLAAHADLLTVPLGLALGGDAADGRRIDLLPREIAVERANRRQLVMAGGAVAAVAAGLFGLFLVAGYLTEWACTAGDPLDRGLPVLATRMLGYLAVLASVILLYSFRRRGTRVGYRL